MILIQTRMMYNKHDVDKLLQKKYHYLFPVLCNCNTLYKKRQEFSIGSDIFDVFFVLWYNRS